MLESGGRVCGAGGRGRLDSLNTDMRANYRSVSNKTVCFWCSDIANSYILHLSPDINLLKKATPNIEQNIFSVIIMWS